MKYNLRTLLKTKGKRPPANIQKLMDWSTETNIAADKSIDQSKLEQLGELVVNEYQIDLTSRADWERNAEKGLKLAQMVAGEKNFPYPGASNNVYPLVAQAVTQFASRTLPSIVVEGQAVKVKVQGEKTDKKIERANSVSDHMSYQVTEQIDNWVDDTDALLHHYASTGLAFRKMFWNVEEDKPASMFLTYEDVVIHYHTKSLESAKRITHVYEITPNELTGRQRTGEYLSLEEVDLGEGDTETKEGDQGDSQNPYEILEQSRWYDLDDDGYFEPYNVFVHKATKKVLRITARWEPDAIDWNDKDEVTYIKAECYYVKYQFMPSFDRSFYPMGYGHLIGHPNKMVNSIINQMCDAATLANTGGGFVSDDLQIFGKQQKSGLFIRRPGEYMVVHDKGMNTGIKDKILQFDFQGPSLASFQLLGLILEGAERLGNVTQVLSGEAQYSNQPAYGIMLLIEQATKFYTAVKVRLYKSLREEYRKLYYLNYKHVQDADYNRLLDDERVYHIAKKDYETESLDVVPVADPKEATDAQKLIKAQAVQEVVDRPITNPRQRKVAQLQLEALQVEDAEEYLPTDEELGQVPPDIQLERDKLAVEQSKLSVDERKLEIESRKTDAEILKLRAESVKALAEAESKEFGSQLEECRFQLDLIRGALEQAGMLTPRGGNGGQPQQDQGSAGNPNAGKPETVSA